MHTGFTKHRIELFLLSIAVLVFGASFYVFNALYSPISRLSSADLAGEQTVIEIVEGSSLSRVTSELQSQGYIQHPNLFKLLARLRGVENAIKTGEYALEPGITAAALLRKMVSGDTLQYRITLVEGWTFAQALEAIWESDNIAESLSSLSLAQIAERLNLDRDNPEGLLYPDTYFYTKGTTDLDLLIRANRRLDTVLNSIWETRSLALPYATAYDALIMASIIEKESASDSERGLIASVFISRLNRSMRLQSDPTVIYGRGESYSGNISRADLLEETAYNTYRINGLPPTPVALSGETSIRAALSPSSSDYLYFVARGDGSHQFSRTLEEHNAAVQQYQLNAGN